jgi:flagellar hook-associated protein 3 FlgL
MRVTESMKFQSSLAAQSRAAERLELASKRASTGLKVERPSDDPAAFAASLRNDARSARLGARIDGMAKAQEGLTLAESMLTSGADVMSAAHQLALSMAGDDMSADERTIAADQIATLREQLLGTANTAGPEGYLFGGTRLDAAPFDAAGAFAGNDDAVAVEVADGVTVAANASGARAFAGAGGGRNLFADLSALETALRANDRAGVSAMLSPLEQGRAQITAERSRAGLGIERLASASEASGRARDALVRAKAGLVEADAPSAYSELIEAQGSYERALAVAKKILGMPLPEY